MGGLLWDPRAVGIRRGGGGEEARGEAGGAGDKTCSVRLEPRLLRTRGRVSAIRSPGHRDWIGGCAVRLRLMRATGDGSHVVGEVGSIKKTLYDL